jgi:hypothetical protein
VIRVAVVQVFEVCQFGSCICQQTLMLYTKSKVSAHTHAVTVTNVHATRHSMRMSLFASKYY